MLRNIIPTTNVNIFFFFFFSLPPVHKRMINEWYDTPYTLHPGSIFGGDGRPPRPVRDIQVSAAPARFPTVFVLGATPPAGLGPGLDVFRLPGGGLARAGSWWKERRLRRARPHSGISQVGSRGWGRGGRREHADLQYSFVALCLCLLIFYRSWLFAQVVWKFY